MSSNDDTNSTPTPTSDQLFSRSIRGKSDIAWAYVSEGRSEDGKKTFTCCFCSKIVKGGGIHRMKMHLAGQRGEIGPCKKVPGEIRFKIQEALKEYQDQKKENKLNESFNPFGRSAYEFQGDMARDEDIEILEGGSSKSSGASCKRKAPLSLKSYFPSGSGPGSQPTIKAALQSKEKWHQVDLAIARFFYDACIPMNAANSFYFQPMVDAIASMGLGYKGPAYHALRTNLLEDCKKELQLLVDFYRSNCAECGCTIMGDGWKDARQRSLINFLVYCPKGICFIKSVDASDMISDAQTLCKLFADIVEIVGSHNVVQVVTDNAANYKAAGKLLNEKYPNILWTPCAAHCINLILKDISKMSHVESLAKRASSITVFVYNHKWTLSWLRRRDGWTEILRPRETRFATTFIALKSLHDHKCDLQSMVTSRDFMSWNVSKTVKAKEVQNSILDNKFWNDCLVIIKIVAPLIRMLRIVDSDEKPAMGYVYDGMLRARKAIMETFKNKSRLYEPYTTILDERWKGQMHQDIHAVAYWLNPVFQYDRENACETSEVMKGLVSILGDKHITFVTDDTLMLDSCMFRDRKNTFGSEIAHASCKNIRPDEWWRFFGHDISKLQKVAIRILSQTASSSGCERNWSVFERIHTKRRNKLEHERLSDLVYIHYNLRLKNRHFNKNKFYDPIDYECIDKIDTWIIEDEPPQEPELNFEELETMANDQSENVVSLGDERCANDDEDVFVGEQELDLSSFGGVNDHDDHDVEN